MREANFSIPNANKASVGITTALYDRRALDCTSTLPLINSLNHLAYLTNSSARIREILTIDGGVEKLISILKDGRSSDVMEAWKWNLAFQCVVNIGVRGSDARSAESRSSENVRTRVVEADIVPVIATILNNYMQALEKWKAKQGIDPEASRSRAKPSRSSKRAALGSEMHPRGPGLSASSRHEHSRRRQGPPAHLDLHRLGSRTAEDPRETPQRETSSQSEQDPQVNIVASVNERPLFSQHHANIDPHPQRPRLAQWRRQFQDTRRNGSRDDMDQPPLPRDSLDLHRFTPVRDIDNLVSPNGLPHLGISSQPDSPATPATGRDLRPVNPRRSVSVGRAVQRRPALQRQASSSGASDDEQAEPRQLQTTTLTFVPTQSFTEIQSQSDVDMDDVVPDPAIVDDNNSQESGAALTVADMNGNTAEHETLTLAIRSAEGGVMDPGATPTNGTMQGLSPLAAEAEPNVTTSPQHSRQQRSVMPPSMVPITSPSVVRDEDVIMSLQLLAYVSKYTNLRTYFLNTHLVPKLQITDGELTAIETGQHYGSRAHEEPASNDDEYCQDNNFNIFPLVEKFTVRHHSLDMKEWAGVVMRNLCRKDKSRGDIRQCAYYECGKWEEYQRQFAKCRACRQTKYCSKECQKQAWVYHRHWCQLAERSSGAGPSSQPAPEAPTHNTATAESWNNADT